MWSSSFLVCLGMSQVSRTPIFLCSVPVIHDWYLHFCIYSFKTFGNLSSAPSWESHPSLPCSALLLFFLLFIPASVRSKDLDLILSSSRRPQLMGNDLFFILASEILNQIQSVPSLTFLVWQVDVDHRSWPASLQSSSWLRLLLTILSL